jgi:hypothetical protein
VIPAGHISVTWHPNKQSLQCRVRTGLKSIRHRIRALLPRERRSASAPIREPIAAQSRPTSEFSKFLTDFYGKPVELAYDRDPVELQADIPLELPGDMDTNNQLFQQHISEHESRNRTYDVHPLIRMEIPFHESRADHSPYGYPLQSLSTSMSADYDPSSASPSMVLRYPTQRNQANGLVQSPDTFSDNSFSYSNPNPDGYMSPGWNSATSDHFSQSSFHVCLPFFVILNNQN